MFSPKGMAGKEIGGFAAGEALGGAVGSGGDALGAAGMLGGVIASDKGEGLKPIVALSPEKIYVLRPNELVGGVLKEDLSLLNTFDRAIAHVTVTARVTVRTLVIDDAEGGQKVELEGDRVWGKHSKEVIHALVGDSQVEEGEDSNA
jgi:hypothetical protein